MSRDEKPPFARRAAISIGKLRDVAPARITGTITALGPYSLEVSGLTGHASVGDRIEMRATGRQMVAEIIAFRRGVANAVPFGMVEGLRRLEEDPASVFAKFPDVWVVANR